MAGGAKCLPVGGVPQFGAGSGGRPGINPVGGDQLRQRFDVVTFECGSRSALHAAAVALTHRVNPFAVLVHLADRLSEFRQTAFPLVVLFAARFFAACSYFFGVFSRPSFVAVGRLCLLSSRCV